MEVSEDIYNWLDSTRIFDLESSPDKYIIPSDVCISLESGHGFAKLIKHLHQIKVTVI